MATLNPQCVSEDSILGIPLPENSTFDETVVDLAECQNSAATPKEAHNLTVHQSLDIGGCTII